MSEVIEQESTELVTLPAYENALQVFTTEDALNRLYAEVESKVVGVVYDMSTKKGRDQCASDAYKVARSKQAVEKLGAKLAAEYKEIPKKIDASRRSIKERFDALQERIRQPLNEWEATEERRVANHKAGIQHIKGCGEGFIDGKPAAFGLLFYELEEKMVIDAKWEEFEAEAHRAKDEALASLKVMFAEHQKREAEQAELAKLRAEAEERRIQDERERIAREAAEAATKAAEAKAQAEREAAAKREADAKAAQAKAEQDAKDAAERQRRAEEQAEAERLASIERAKQAAEAARLAEIKRQADEAAQIEAEAKKREADREHKGKVLRKAKEAIMAAGITEDQARAVIKLISAGKVPRVSIEY